MSRPFTEERLTALLQRKNTFWRHDIDISLTAAVKMAELEYSLGVHGTFYLMLNSPGYLPSDAFLASLTIRAMGHRIGLHVDERHWMPNTELAEGLDLAAPVSFHVPSEAVLWKRFPGIENAYDPNWEGSYFADSRGRFAHGDPEDHDEDAPLQINLHPCWWFEPEAPYQLSYQQYQQFFREPHPDFDPLIDGPGVRPSHLSLVT